MDFEFLDSKSKFETPGEKGLSRWENWVKKRTYCSFLPEATGALQNSGNDPVRFSNIFAVLALNHIYFTMFAIKRRTEPCKLKPTYLLFFTPGWVVNRISLPNYSWQHILLFKPQYYDQQVLFFHDFLFINLPFCFVLQR